MDVILLYLLKNGQEGGSAAPRTERGRVLVPSTSARSLSQQNAQECTRLYVTYVHPYVATVLWRGSSCVEQTLEYTSHKYVTDVPYHVLCFGLDCRWIDANCTKQYSLLLSVSRVFPSLSFLCSGLVVINGHFWTNNIMRQPVLQSVFMVTMGVRAMCRCCGTVSEIHLQSCLMKYFLIWVYLYFF
jgi:hypothetical protein